jgi:hypothetical protein
MIMRWSTILAMAAISTLTALSPARAEECQLLGNRSGWGQNTTGAFEIDSGKSCTIGVNTYGIINNTKISKRPQHGKLTQVSLSNFEYVAEAGYQGQDSFVLEGSGQDAGSAGTSVVTLNVTVH